MRRAPTCSTRSSMRAARSPSARPNAGSSSRSPSKAWTSAIGTYQVVLRGAEKERRRTPRDRRSARRASSMSDEMRNRDIVIAEGTSRTGGRRDQVLALSGLPDKLKQAADELINQYVVSLRAAGHTDSAGEDRGQHDPPRIVTVRARTQVRRSLNAPAPARITVALVALSVRLAIGVGDGAGAVPRRRRSRVAQRHRDARARGTSPISRNSDFEIFEDGVKQQTTLLLEGAAADRARRPARHQRQHGEQARDGAGSGDRLRPPHAAAAT